MIQPGGKHGNSEYCFKWKWHISELRMVTDKAGPSRSQEAVYGTRKGG